jgi:cytochrome P450
MATLTSVPVAPGSLPLLGHLVPLFRDPLGLLASLPERGDLVRLRLGPVRALLVCDPGLVRQVLLDDRTYDKGGPLYDRLRDVGRDGLAVCPHSRHRRQRRLVQPAFHADRLPGYAETMTDRITAVIESWREDQVVDVLHEMMKITSRTIVATMLSDSLPASVLHAMPVHVDTLITGVFRQALLPDLLRNMPTPTNRRFFGAVTALRNSLGAVVTDRRASHTDRHDLLSALLDARDPGGDSQGDGGGLTDVEIVDHMLTFLLAGVETTATTLAWALHLLALHPGIEDRLHAEVDAVLDGRPAGHGDLPSLRLTGQIITETLRLRSPAWITTRMVTTNTQLGGVEIPAGSVIVISPYLLHQRQDSFPHPNRFDPDRWTTKHPTAVSRSAYIPFGGGARKCVGDQFGLTEAALALATITNRWHLEPVSNQQVRPGAAISLRPRNLRMRAVARRS